MLPLSAVRKNGGSIVHWKEEGERLTLCRANHGNRNIGRSGWVLVALAGGWHGMRWCKLCVKLKEDCP